MSAHAVGQTWIATSVLLAAGIAAAVPSVVAQDATAPHLSPEFKVLYAHHNETDTAELTGWMNTLETDVTGADIAIGPSGNAFAGTRTYTITLNPPITGKVMLDKTKPVVITAFLGGGSANGAIRVSTAVSYGGAAIATGAEQNHAYQQAGTGAYPKLTWSVNPTVDALEPGKALVWTLSITGVGQPFFLGVSKDRGRSNVDLPVASADVAPSIQPTLNLTYHDLTGEELLIELEADSPANQSHQFNWTSNLTSAEIAFQANVNGGNASFLILGPGDEVIANRTLNASQEETITVDDPPAGNWTVRVDLREFSGSLRITAKAPEPAPPPTSGPPANTSATANGTSSPTDDGGGIPAPSLAAGVLALAAIALLRRRRA